LNVGKVGGGVCVFLFVCWCVCVCVRARAYVYVCVCARMCVSGFTSQSKQTNKTHNE